MNKQQLKSALVKLGVAPDQFKNLELPALQELYKQKQIEKAQADAELLQNQGAGGDGDGTDDSDGADDGSEGDIDEGGEGDGEDFDEDDENAGSGEGGEINQLDHTSGAGQTVKTNAAKKPPVDSDSVEYEGLIKLRSRGFQGQSLGVVIAKGATYSAGKEFTVKDGDEFWADEKTCEHLLGYRVAEKD